MSAAASSSMSPARCWPGCRPTSIAITACRSATPPAARPCTCSPAASAWWSAPCSATACRRSARPPNICCPPATAWPAPPRFVLAFALPAGPGAARRARNRHVPRRRHGGSGRRDGRQSDAGANPRHRLRHPDRGQQCPRPRARPDPHRPARRRLGPARRLAACCRLPAWRRQRSSSSGSRTYAADLDTHARTAA